MSDLPTTVITISGVRGYIGQDGTAYLNLEDVARGLGFTERKPDGTEYVRWARVKSYLDEFRFATSGESVANTFIPENIFYRLAMKASNDTANAFQAKVANEILPAIRKTGMYSVVPATVEDLIILQAQSIKELKARVAAIEEKAAAAHHRIDVLDAINTIGDPQQRLNAMVRKYAHREGLTFSRAWNDFVQAYNTAYRTNLKLLKANYELRHGRKVTIPQYLAGTQKIEDGLRVADRMLNATSATA